MLKWNNFNEDGLPNEQGLVLLSNGGDLTLAYWYPPHGFNQYRTLIKGDTDYFNLWVYVKDVTPDGINEGHSN